MAAPSISSGSESSRDGIRSKKNKAASRLKRQASTMKDDKTKIFPPEKAIEEVIVYIVSERLGIEDADVGPWVKLLKGHLIFNLGLLCRLSLDRLKRIGLPLLLEEELAQAIDWSTNQKEKLPLVAMFAGDVETLKSKVPVVSSTDRSSLLGITSTERQLIRDSWEKAMAITRDKTEVDLFERTFYNKFMSENSVAKKLFIGTTPKKQASVLKKIIRKILESLDNPTEVTTRLSRLGARHMIYGVKSEDFRSFALAFTQAMEVVCTDIMTPALKEAWYSLIINMGKVMVRDYDKIKEGFKGDLWKRSGAKWTKNAYKITHETLYIYKTDECIKVRDEIVLRDVTNKAFAGDLDSAPYNFCYSFDVRNPNGFTKYQFCFDTQNTQKKFAMLLNERVVAHARAYRERDDSGSGSIKSQGSEMNLVRDFSSKIKGAMTRKNKTSSRQSSGK